MNSSLISKYKPAIILTLALTVFLVSCKPSTKSGVVSTLAGSTEGYHDNAGEAAQFRHPTGVAVDSSGNIYVAEWGNDLIRKITSKGVVSTLAGSTEGFADGAAATAQFDSPLGVAVDSSGILYVADFNNHRIRKISSERGVSPLAGSGTAGYNAAPATGTEAQFNFPSGVAVDSSGILYMADYGNHRIREIEYK